MSPLGHTSAAIDPFGFFIALIIIINIVSAFARRARQQRAANATPARPSAAEEAMRKAAADAAAARQAQRARLEQAIRAAQARVQQTIPQPAVVVSTTPVVAPAPAPVAAPTTPLPSFDFPQEMLAPLISTSALYAAPAAAPARFTVLGSRLTGAELFVAAAIVGPPAALRSVGHTPAGW